MRAVGSEAESDLPSWICQVQKHCREFFFFFVWLSTEVPLGYGSNPSLHFSPDISGVADTSGVIAGFSKLLRKGESISSTMTGKLHASPSSSSLIKQPFFFFFLLRSIIPNEAVFSIDPADCQASPFVCWHWAIELRSDSSALLISTVVLFPHVSPCCKFRQTCHKLNPSVPSNGFTCLSRLHCADWQLCLTMGPLLSKFTIRPALTPRFSSPVLATPRSRVGQPPPHPDKLLLHSARS